MSIRDAFRKANQTIADSQAEIERGRQADQVAKQRAKRQNQDGEKK